jgi:hypothetical protein
MMTIIHDQIITVKPFVNQKAPRRVLLRNYSLADSPPVSVSSPPVAVSPLSGAFSSALPAASHVQVPQFLQPPQFSQAGPLHVGHFPSSI